jgi:hypothetical protein
MTPSILLWLIILAMSNSASSRPPGGTSADSTKPATIEAYQDLNGDGFNDHLDDVDGNNIPDRFQKAKPGPHSSDIHPSSGLDLNHIFPLDFSKMSAAAEFTERWQAARDLLLDQVNRMMLETTMNASSSASTSACAGGVCISH